MKNKITQEEVEEIFLDLYWETEGLADTDPWTGRKDGSKSCIRYLTGLLEAIHMRQPNLIIPKLSTRRCMDGCGARVLRGNLCATHVERYEECGRGRYNEPWDQ